MTHENEKEETFGREAERIPDVGLHGRIPVAGRAAVSGGGLQRLGHQGRELERWRGRRRFPVSGAASAMVN